MKSYPLCLLLSSVVLGFVALMGVSAQVHANEPSLATHPAAIELKQLFADSDEASLKRRPLDALFRGDLRYADQLGDYLSEAYYHAERMAAQAELKRLHAIKRHALNLTDKISYDVFKWQTELALKGYSPSLLPLMKVRPIDHFTGLHVFYPDLASGKGAAPFQTLSDYDNNLKRHREYILWLERSIERFREGMETGVVQPKLVINNVIAQLDLQLAQGIEGSTFYRPVTHFPAAINAADQIRLIAEYKAVIGEGIAPAYQRLRDFLHTEYLPKARESVGLVHMKGGKQLYQYLIESNTTLPLTANYIHKLGLTEVLRIHQQMEAIRQQTGFKGSLSEFFEYFRTDPQFKFSSHEDIQQTFSAIGKRVDIRIHDQFSTLPKASLDIRPVPEYREKTDAAGSYMSGTPDGTRPGIFYFNRYDLPSRSKPSSETLYLHEAIPGHHFQISLAQENTALPAFMRFGGNSAYTEGWALYAESLWQPLGMETDPYARFGGLNAEMWRAIRLVVDTGIHAKGWSREQAIDYMLANSGLSKASITAEVERYIAMPGQALSYKIGQLRIQRLKDKAMKALGARFDPRAFHDQILMTGALPLPVLEKKINEWISATK